MTSTLEQSEPRTTSGLPGAAMLRRLRALIVVAAITAFAYSGMVAASKSQCFGGFGTDGGYIGTDGRASETAPLCVSATLHSSPVILIAIAVIVVVAIGRVLARARDEASAILTFQRAGLVVIVLAVVSIIVGYAWFALNPLDGFLGEGFHYLGFPFVTADVTTAPMTPPVTS